MEQENSAKRRIGRKRRERLEHAGGFQSLGWGLPSDSARRAVNMEGENYAAGTGFWRYLERMNPSVSNSSITRKCHGDGDGVNICGNSIDSSSRGRETHGVGEGGNDPWQNLISSIDGDQEKIGGQGGELSDGDEWLEHQDGAGAEVMATASSREAEALPRKHKFMAWWGGFLPHRKLSILLVEGDGSSRKVVSALLRNCDYEVICAENGEEAWEFLCGPTNKVDLVLSEVFMPSLSGITLLCKIMTQGPSKNVPVIMMSSHDSMAVSFKCLSNGAVDFLIKPVRKNELKNIWQHIWRRNRSLHDGSNGGEESQPKQAPQHLGSFCSNADECDMETGYVNAGNESDNGSGTQGSRTGPAITVTKATNVLLKLGARDVNQVNKMCAPASAEHTNAELEPEGEDEGRGEYEDIEAREEVEAGWSGTKAVDRIVTSPCEGRSRNIEHHDISMKAPASPSNVPCKESYLYSLELSLKRTEDEGGMKFVHNKALRQSSSSAFSRYSNCANSLSRPSRIDVSHMPAYLNDQNSILIQSNGGTHTQLATPEEKGCSSRVTNDNCSLHPPAPTGLDLFVSPALHKELSPSGFCPLPVPLQYSPLVYGAVLRSYGHVYPMFYSSHPAAAQQPVPCPVVEREGFSGLKASSQGLNLPSDLHLPVHQSSYHSHHLQFQHHHGYHFQHALRGNEQAVMDTRSSTPTCRSSNRTNLNGTGSFNESATASNNASNDNQGTGHGQNGTLFTSAALAEGGTWYTVDALGCNRTLLGPDENPSSRREAALIKFRQKRNERCFEKKVRYQTRKKMAEQRPRVRGQFVRRAAIAQN